MSAISIASIQEIGRRLREKRKSAKVSTMEMGDALGVTDSTYGRWEKAEQEGGCRLVMLAAAKLGMTPNELMLAGLSEIEDPTVDTLPEDTLNDLRRIRELIFQVYHHSGGRLRSERVLLKVMEEVSEQVLAQESLPFGTEIQAPEPSIRTGRSRRKRK